ncbi:MAG: hypothetical protein PWR31_1780 [Bacillota bacterium]|nr:hypothetical protein [Bacillota bacterium]
MKAHTVVRIALIAALYAALTYALQAVSFMPTQFRAAEALTVLPIIYPEAIWGVFLGCLLANLMSPAGLIDVVVGSLTTLLAAWVTYRFRHSVIAYLAPVVLNAFIISAYLHVLARLPYWATALSIGASEALVVFGLGCPLIWYLKRKKS